MLVEKGNSKNCHVVVVGNGIAGNSAIKAIRNQDKDVNITLISRENLPLYSPCVFHKYIAGERERQKVFLKSFEDYSREKVKLIFGEEVTGLDTKNKEVYVGNKTIRFDKLILATGSNAFFPPIKGININGVFTLKSMEDADRIFGYPMRKAVIIGSGPIGLEAAVALKKRGVEVYDIEVLDRVLPRLFDYESSILIKNILERYGIKILTNEKVVEILGEEKVKSVVTDKRSITCDAVIVAAGVRPNVEIAKQAGLKIGKLGGIVTDEYMRTSVEDVYACGDCVESKDIISGENTLSLLWHNAKRQGEVAGYNCVSEKKRYTGSIDAVSIDIFGTYAISIGKISSNLKNKCDIIEKTDSLNYCRLVLLEDRLVGVQLITKTEDSGILLSLIIRKDNLKLLKEKITSKKLTLVYP